MQDITQLELSTNMIGSHRPSVIGYRNEGANLLYFALTEPNFLGFILRLENYVIRVFYEIKSLCRAFLCEDFYR